MRRVTPFDARAYYYHYRHGSGAAALGSAVDAAAQAIFNAFTTPPTDARKALIAAVVSSLKSSGVWTLLDVLVVQAAADSQAALINWKNPGTFNATAVNSPTFTTDRGFASNATTSYVNTNYTPSTAGGNFVQNSAHVSLWNRTESDGPLDMGVQDGTSHTGIYPRNSGATYGRINDPAGGTSGGLTNASAIGHVIANRSGSSAQELYYNGSSLGAMTPVTSAAPATKAIFVCGFNDNGTPFLPGSDQIAAYSIGGGMSASQASSFYSALLAYLQGVGAA